MATSAELMRAWRGPAVLSQGFRPMFLAGALWAATAMALWIAVLAAGLRIPSPFDPLAFHVHALLWGFGSAAIAGFLLTAVPNWTGRLPIVGRPLAGLFAVWLAGRLAVTVGAGLPAVVVAAVELSFLAFLAGAIGREILAGGSRRNLPVLGLLLAFLLADAFFHWEAARGLAASSGVGMRLGVAVIVVLIALVGGRIVPSFTRNWLARRSPGRLPASFGRFDRVALAAAATALLAFVVAPGAVATGALAGLAGLLNLARLARWAGWRTLGEPLVAVLHVGYLFVPVGLVLLAGAILLPDRVPQVAALHAFTAGAVGTMTLAVMTRASLGHTGRDLRAGPATLAVYGLVLLAAPARIAAAFAPDAAWLLHLSAAGWIGAFLLFSAAYGPMLTRPRAGGSRAR